MNKLIFLLALSLSVSQAFSAEETGSALPSQEFSAVESNQETALTEESWNMAGSSATTTISQTQYYVGAAFETAGFVLPILATSFGSFRIPLLSGWGIGHAIQGRYSDRGWIFTVATGTLYTGVVASLLFFSAEALNTAAETTDEKTQQLRVLGSIAKMGTFVIVAGAGIIGVSIWNIVDVWDLPSHYKVAKEKPFSVKPLFAFYNEEEMDIGHVFKI